MAASLRGSTQPIIVGIAEIFVLKKNKKNKILKIFFGVM
jgi:hypothetical protein